MMLDLTTKRMALDFMLDGKPASVPVELTRQETIAFGKAYERAEKAGEIDAGLEMSDTFAEFAESYAPGVKALSFDALRKLMEAWQELRSETAEAPEGE